MRWMRNKGKKGRKNEILVAFFFQCESLHTSAPSSSVFSCSYQWTLDRTGSAMVDVFTRESGLKQITQDRLGDRGEKKGSDNQNNYCPGFKLGVSAVAEYNSYLMARLPLKCQPQSDRWDLDREKVEVQEWQVCTAARARVACGSEWKCC